MRNTTTRPKTKMAYLLFPVLALLLSGCAGPKIAVDLLAKVDRNTTPLTTESSTVNVKINPHINNYEKLDVSVKQSLEIAIANANIFGSASTQPYRIDADILVASQSPMNFGSFKGQLDIRYVVLDPSGNKLIDKTIATVAGSDKWYFNGAARHRRSRAVNISKNVRQFLDILERQLQK